MKLSEAIRAGAKIRPQARGTFERTVKQRWIDRVFRRKPVVTTCAWKAALEAQGCGYRQEKITANAVRLRDGYSEIPPVGTIVQVPDVPAEWEAITCQRGVCPQCDSSDFVIRLITHLNDDHAWTREAIAVWVQRFESSVPVVLPVAQVKADVLDATEIG